MLFCCLVLWLHSLNNQLLRYYIYCICLIIQKINQLMVLISNSTLDTYILTVWVLVLIWIFYVLFLIAFFTFLKSWLRALIICWGKVKTLNSQLILIKTLLNLAFAVMSAGKRMPIYCIGIRLNQWCIYTQPYKE